MSEYRVVQDYPDPPERVWCALTDPEIVPLWTSTGRQARWVCSGRRNALQVRGQAHGGLEWRRGLRGA